MRAQFNDVFACVGVRRGKPGRNDFVEWPVGLGAGRPDARERRVPRLQRHIADEDSCGDFLSVASTDADDAKASPAGRSRDCDDAVVGREHAARWLGARTAPQRARPDQRRAEMITVFMNASPMLSELTEGSSAIAMCTMRRS